MLLKNYLEQNCEIIPSVNLLRLKNTDKPTIGFVKAYLPPINALEEGILDINLCKVMYIPKDKLKYCLQKGDILVKCQNETLMTIVDDENIICSSYAIGIKVKEQKQLYELISSLTSNEFYKIGTLSKVAVVNRVNVNEIMAYKMQLSARKGELIYKMLEIKFLRKKLHELEDIAQATEIKQIKKIKLGDNNE